MNYHFKSLYSNEQYTLQINRGSYSNGNVAMTLIDCVDGLPFATATINHNSLQEGEVAIKDYSENAGVLIFLLDNNIVKPPHRFINSGFVNIPVCKLK